MSFKLFIITCLVSASLCEKNITKKSDSEISGTDFAPQFQPFRFPGQPVFGAPQDLTPLQQTHSLGSFHHRFHPTRLAPQFGNPTPLVFAPQPHIVPPRPIQDQRSLQGTSQSSTRHEDSQILVPPQPPVNQNFKATQKPQNSFGNDQYIKNAFPSNAPHTIKFSISSLSHNPNQNKQFVNPSTPQPRINHQLSSGRFVSQQISSQPLNTNFRQQNEPPKLRQTGFQSFNSKKPEVPHSQNFNLQSTSPFGPTQGPASPDPSGQYHLNLVHSQNIRTQQSNELTVDKPVLSSPGHGNFGPTEQSKFSQQSLIANQFRQNELQQQANFKQQQELQQQQAKYLQQQELQQQQAKLLQAQELQQQQAKLLQQQELQRQQELQQQQELQRQQELQQQQAKILQEQELQQQQAKILQEQELQQQQAKYIQQQELQQQQAKFNQQQFIQSNFEFSQVQSQQPGLNHVQPSPQTHLQFQQQDQQILINNQPSPQPTFEFQSTEQPRRPTEAFPSGNNQEISPTVQAQEVFQKSREQSQYVFQTKHPNEVYSSASPSPTTAGTTISTKYRKPKPIVKEIRIDLNEKSKGSDIPAQLYIKENRQKEFQEIKEQEQSSKGKKEKSQEDVINEQIQKLLQSHNLEIIDKDNDSQTESQEAHLSQFSEQFKKKYNYSVQLLNGGSLLGDVKQKKKAVPTTLPSLPPLPDLPEHIKKQYDIKLVHRDELFKQFDLPENHKLGNDSNVFLANGQQLELVKFTKDGLMNKIAIGSLPEGPTTTAKPPKLLFEELKKGVIPPGADFELIRHNENGEIEKVNDLDNAKKVTFVFLEEQPDGSVKVQGVKGNANQETEENDTVDSLIKKIKDGSLKLPPSKSPQGKTLLANEISRINPVTHKSFVTFPPSVVTSPRSIQNFPTTQLPFYLEKETTEQGPTTDFAYSSPYAVDIDATYTPTPYYETTPEPPTTFQPTVHYIRSSSRKSKSRSRVSFLPTVSSIDSTVTTFGSRRIKPTTASPLLRNVGTPRKSQSVLYSKPSSYDEQEYTDAELLSHRSTEYSGQRLRVPQDVIAEESNIDAVRPLKEILRENDLNEMAKFLDQSGLDTILNETGPYTIFIPTDKAFKSLEAQLGGADKAEDKFRENPRLLSGLLLHHVVPGSFRLEDLQDEMTGVSLAGTQLRVNTYSSDSKSGVSDRIVTINGAKVSTDQKDINVPQGLAHAIDRVLFPLPIGDILQTLRADRERRFTKFLKSLESSGLTDMLTGSKTYTVFAPTDKAFSVLTDSELDKLLTRREAARTIVLRHIVPGTLYSAGMNYYQVKESMESGQKVVIKKELGKIKVNSAQIISANIPATNGVIHAVESLL